MRVLIVDDNASRSRKVVELLGSLPAEGGVEVIAVNHADAARDELSESYFDLLIIDIVIPRSSCDPSPDASKSLALLMEIVDADLLVKPGYVLGITAFDSAHDEVAASFSARTWTVLRADETSNDWLDQLRACFLYISRVKEQPQNIGYGLDVLVLTALRSPEMDAVHRIPWTWEAERPIDDVTFIREGSFSSRGKPLSVCTAVAHRMGLVPMALTAGKLISKLKPRLVVMPGICAGVRGRVELGDVVFAELSWDYQVGKHHVQADSISSFAIEPYAIPSASSVSAKIDQLSRDDELWAGIAKEWVERVRPPRLIRAPMASGSSVLADAAVTELIVHQQRKVAAIEMEAYAMYAAAEFATSPRPVAIALKAVCDFADSSKDDAVQPYASYVSAQAMRVFLERYATDLIGNSS